MAEYAGIPSTRYTPWLDHVTGHVTGHVTDEGSIVCTMLCFTMFLQLPVSRASTIWPNQKAEFKQDGMFFLLLQPEVARTWNSAFCVTMRTCGQ